MSGATDKLLGRLIGVASGAITADDAAAFPTNDDVVYDGVISALWRTKKFDTKDIARHLREPESFVAKRLAALRDGGAL